MNNSLIEAFKSSPPSPCDSYKCPCRKQCSTKKMACDAFVHYVSTGRVLNPRMQFRGVADRRRAVGILNKEPEPNQFLYYRLFQGK